MNARKSYLGEALLMVAMSAIISGAFVILALMPITRLSAARDTTQRNVCLVESVWPYVHIDILGYTHADWAILIVSYIVNDVEYRSAMLSSSIAVGAGSTPCWTTSVPPIMAYSEIDSGNYYWPFVICAMFVTVCPLAYVCVIICRYIFYLCRRQTVAPIRAHDPDALCDDTAPLVAQKQQQQQQQQQYRGWPPSLMSYDVATRIVRGQRKQGNE